MVLGKRAELQIQAEIQNQCCSRSGKGVNVDRRTDEGGGRKELTQHIGLEERRGIDPTAHPQGFHLRPSLLPIMHCQY